MRLLFLSEKNMEIKGKLEFKTLLFLTFYFPPVVRE